MYLFLFEQQAMIMFEQIFVEHGIRLKVLFFPVHYRISKPIDSRCKLSLKQHAYDKQANLLVPSRHSRQVQNKRKVRSFLPCS